MTDSNPSAKWHPGDKILIEAEYVMAVDFADDRQPGYVEGAMLLIGGKSVCIPASALPSRVSAEERAKGRKAKARAYALNLYSCNACDFDSGEAYPSLKEAQRAAFAHNRDVHGASCPRYMLHPKHGGGCWLCEQNE